MEDEPFDEGGEPRGLLEPAEPDPTLVHRECPAQSRGAVVRDGGKVDDALGDLPASDDSYLSGSWSCVACGHTLADEPATPGEGGATPPASP